MKYNILGKTGIKISELCFGTMTFGKEANEVESEKMFNLCFERGINIFDTANVYNGGLSEELLGKFVQKRNCRNNVVISTKVGSVVDKGANNRGTSRRHIINAVEDSLKRLKTDRIDIYFIHRFDNSVPIEETLDALDYLVKSGKIIYTGVSNWAAWQIMKSLGISRNESLSSFSCVQPMYNLIKRQAEVEILPMCKSEGLGILSYSPIGSGVLTGKYINGAIDGSARLNDKDYYAARYSRPDYFETAQRFCQMAKDINVHPASLAIKWVSYGGNVTAPIVGARTVEQLESGLKSVEIPMDDSLYNSISSLTELPPSPTDRLEEQVLQRT